MSNMRRSGAPVGGPEKMGRGTGGPMWAMWMCCLVPLLLFLIWSFLRR